MTHSKFWKEISDDCEDVTEAEDCVDALEWDTKNNPALAAKKPPPVYLYIVMQLCQKESLRVWLRNTSETRSRVKALFMFNEICNGVEYVHSQGLIHRYVIIDGPEGSVTQILREINFGKCKSSKNAILAISEALNFRFGYIPAFRKRQNS